MLNASFIIFLAIILFIGLYARRFSKKTTADYLSASRGIPAWQTILSALASNSSGFMYIGLIGYTYVQGISGMWLMVFWVIGEYLMISYIPKKINTVSHNKNLLSYDSLLSNYWGEDKILIKKTAAIITLVFLSIYAAAQFGAAGKAMSTLLDWDIVIGMFGAAGKTMSTLLDWDIVIGMVATYVMVVAYSFAGGIRASIWTDGIQFVVMFVSIILLVIFSLNAIGGWGIFVDKLYQNPAEYTQLFPDSMGNIFFIVLFLLGWFAAGLGIAGQPHIIIRFIAMKKNQDYRKIIYGYYSLSFIFTALCILSALLAKVYFNLPPVDFDTETALPKLAMAVLPTVLVGLILAAILSAIISTADSQVLSCSASLGNNLLPKRDSDSANLKQNKLTTMLVATFALVVAIFGGKSVFTLVVIAWSGLASAFAPLLLLQFMGHQISQSLGLVIMLSGLSAAVIWRILSLNDITYDAFVGIAVGFGVFYLAKLFIKIEKS